ncbi:MAG TPA: hypothetical protein VFS43_38300 [Polyangiaceae bacterium]|nr:hypothetical protein [Polyangiaceae bacterium]
MQEMHRIIAEPRETVACSACGRVESFEGTTKVAARKAASAGWRRAAGGDQLACPDCMRRVGSRQQRRAAEAASKRAARKAALARH